MQWLPATLAAEKVCRFIGKGFEKLGDACIAAGKKIVEELVPRILKLIRRIAMRATPAVGWLGALIEGIVEGKLPILAEIDMIKASVKQILSLHETIGNLVSVAENYVKGAQAIMDLVLTIPNLDGGSDLYTAREMGRKFDQGVKAYETYAGKVKKDKDGNVIEDEQGRPEREKSQHDKAMADMERELGKIKKSVTDIKSASGK